MTREQQELYRAAESTYVRMIRNYTYCRLLLMPTATAINVNELRMSARIDFASPSDMRAWVLDVEKSRVRVIASVGFNAWGITGDRFVLGMKWDDISKLHRLSVESCRMRTREWVAAMFVDHLAHRIAEEYREAA